MLHKVKVVRVQEPPVLCNHRRTIKLFDSFGPIQRYKITDSEFQYNLDLCQSQLLIDRYRILLPLCYCSLLVDADIK